jgi:cytochrome b involved in lipid metabolism
MGETSESLKQIALSEVEKHKDSNSVWIIIREHVYDVTKFLEEHPGGEEVLLEQAGKDATEAFDDVGHSTDAKEMMIKYQIGQIREEDRKHLESKEYKWDQWSDKDTSSSWSSWVVPVLIALVVSMAYRYYLSNAHSAGRD